MLKTADWTQRFIDWWDTVQRIVNGRKGKALILNYILRVKLDSRQAGHYYTIRNPYYTHHHGSNAIVEFARIHKLITKPYDETQKFHFDRVPLQQIVAFVDLDQLTMTRCSKLKPPNQQKGILQPSAQTQHVLKIAKHQIAHCHSIFVPYVAQKHPQIMTPKLLQAFIKLSAIIPGMKFGFNSQGAGSTVNHFHVQVMDPKSLIGSDTFYFQTISNTDIVKQESERQAQTYTTYPSIIQPKTKKQIEISSFFYSSAFFVRMHTNIPLVSREIIELVISSMTKILETCFAQKIPHTMYITDRYTIFIALRNYAKNGQNHGWVEHSGVHIASDQTQYKWSEEKVKNSYNPIDKDINYQKVKAQLSNL